MRIPLIDYLSEDDKDDISEDVGVSLDEELDTPLGGDIQNRDLDAFDSTPEDETLQAVNADPMMEDKEQVKVQPESGDGPDIDDPTPTMEAVELGTESRRAMQQMDKALRELDDM